MHWNTEGSETFLEVICDDQHFRMIRSVEPAGTLWEIVNELGRKVLRVPAELGGTVDRLFEDGVFSEALVKVIVNTFNAELEQSWDTGYESGYAARGEVFAAGALEVMVPLMRAFRDAQAELEIEE